MEFDEQLMMDFNGVTVLKYNNTSKYSTIFNSGISVTIERVEDLLQMVLLVPPMFKGAVLIVVLMSFFDLNGEMFGSRVGSTNLWRRPMTQSFKTSSKSALRLLA